jgi:hypothetical protein
METITILFFNYIDAITSWWWSALVVVTLFTATIIVLKDDDYTLSHVKAFRLTIVGLGNLIPFIRNYISFVNRIDFLTRWGTLGLNTFLSFVITIVLWSSLIGPIFLLILFAFRFSDWSMSGQFGHDIGMYGFKNAVKLYFGADPKSLKHRQ